MKYFVAGIVILVTGCGNSNLFKKGVSEPYGSLDISKLQLVASEEATLKWSWKAPHRKTICDLLENGDPLQSEIAEQGETIVTPSVTTNYEILCRVGKEVKTFASLVVEVIPRELEPNEVLVSLETLNAIGKAFPLSEIKELACEDEDIDGCQLEDFIEERSFALELPENKVVYLSELESLFSLENSVLYGLESLHDFDAYQEQCETTPSLNEGDLISNDQTLSKPFEAGEEPVKKVRDPKLIHLKNFRAVTKSFENELPAGTGFDVSFELATTEVSYAAQYEDFGELTGSFAAVDERIMLRNFEFGEEAAIRSSSIPAGYPVPPAKDGYKYDPKHDTCSNPRPQVRNERVYRTPAEFCAPGSHFFGSLECETGQGMPPRWPYVHVYYTAGQPFSRYVQPEPSRRVVSGPGEVQCNTIFPALASEYGLGKSWKARYDHVQWFITDSRWPSCGGYNCTNKVQRTSAADNRYQEVEPYKNFCVDRWKDTNWTTYQNSLQAACMDTEVFKIAKAAKEEADAITKFVQACTPGTDCHASLLAMKELATSFALSTLEKIISDAEIAYDRAFESGFGYLIPNDDPFFSRLSVISGLVNTVIKGSVRIDELLRSTKADWNGAQREITGIAAMTGFESAAARNQTIKNYQSLLERAQSLVEPVVSVISCDYSARGRFRSYLKNDIKDVRQVNIDDKSKSLFLRSLSNLKADK